MAEGLRLWTLRDLAKRCSFGVDEVNWCPNDATVINMAPEGNINLEDRIYGTWITGHPYCEEHANIGVGGVDTENLQFRLKDFLMFLAYGRRYEMFKEEE